MCRQGYFASDVKLPEVRSMNDNAPLAYIDQEKESYMIEALKKIFSKEFIYFVGNCNGCACDLFPSFSILSKKHGAFYEKQTEHFIEYLKKALEKTKDIELFMFWDIETPVEKRRSITIDALRQAWRSLENSSRLYGDNMDGILFTITKGSPND